MAVVTKTTSRSHDPAPGVNSSAGVFNRQRRNLLCALPWLPLAGTALAQSATPVAVRKLHGFAIRVSDVSRSVAFYQDLFGAPIQARQGDSVYLRIGPGPRFFAIKPLLPGQSPGFDYIGLGVADFDLLRVQNRLAAFGVEPGAAPEPGDDPLASAMRSWIVERRSAPGAGPTRELYFADVEGIRYQLMPEDYCGGGGDYGSLCPAPEPAPVPGRFELVDLSHFTTFLANRDRANSFYTRVFGKQYQVYQGPLSPVIGVGDGRQFLMYVGGSEPGVPDSPGRIDHTCFSIARFSVPEILSTLSDYGLRPRQDPADTQPLMHWVSMRMPNRGGAKGGTPEVYFSDPDGISIQLQEQGYCGGSGYLGDSCPPLR